MSGILEKWADRPQPEFKGRRLFVVGSGPSMNDVDLSLLEGQHVWALNAAATLFTDTTRFPDATWMFRDRRAIPQIAPKLAGWKRWRVVTTDKCYAQIEHNGPRVSMTTYKYREPWVHHERTVAEDAIQIARKVGFVDVVLVGVDCAVPAGRPYAEALMWKPCSWYDPAHPVEQSKACASMLGALKRLAESGRLKGFKVYSTSRSCDAFPYVELEHAVTLGAVGAL